MSDFTSTLSDVGIQGPMGPQGPAGARGTTGIQGLTGATGSQGPTGVAGTMGATGLQGVQGPQGPVGIQGLRGYDGPQRPMGPQGVQGLEGNAGAQGPRGAGMELVFWDENGQTEPMYDYKPVVGDRFMIVAKNGGLGYLYSENDFEVVGSGMSADSILNLKYIYNANDGEWRSQSQTLSIQAIYKLS